LIYLAVLLKGTSGNGSSLERIGIQIVLTLFKSPCHFLKAGLRYRLGRAGAGFALLSGATENSVHIVRHLFFNVRPQHTQTHAHTASRVVTWATLELLDVIDHATNDVMSALSPIGALNGAPAASQSARTSIEPY
jgi:hypothetical protein